MNYRKLRIAWSVWCGVVCLLLIMLWVRSYSWADVYLSPNRPFASSQGKLMRFREVSLVPSELPKPPRCVRYGFMNVAADRIRLVAWHGDTISYGAAVL